MNRITPEMVKEAYAKTGLKPERNSRNWFGRVRQSNLACPLAAVAIARDCDTDVIVGQCEMAEFLGTEEEYVEGFVAGVDGDWCSVSGGTPYAIGVEDGKAVAEAVFV